MDGKEEKSRRGEGAKVEGGRGKDSKGKADKEFEKRVDEKRRERHRRRRIEGGWGGTGRGEKEEKGKRGGWGRTGRESGPIRRDRRMERDTFIKEGELGRWGRHFFAMRPPIWQNRCQSTFSLSSITEKRRANGGRRCAIKVSHSIISNHS